MTEKSSYSILQNRNPNPEENVNIDIELLLPTVDSIFTQVKRQEIPNAQKSKTHYPLSDKEITSIIEESLHDVRRIEEAGRNAERWDVPQDVINTASLIVDFSAPGTYFKPQKQDRYKRYPWSWNMDRQRADIAASLGIHIAGLATGNDFSAFIKAGVLDGMNDELNAARGQVRQALHQRNMHFLYLGTKEEAEGIRRVVRTSTSYVPPNLVDIVDKGIDNTVDQVIELKHYLQANVQTDNNPYGFISPSSTILLPMGIQAIRALPMLGKYDAIPEGLKVTLFPIATPASGINEYTTLETKGRVYYTLTNQAARNPISYSLLGEAPITQK